MNIYLEKIAANMKDFAHVYMQNLDNSGSDHAFTAKSFRDVKDTDYFDFYKNRRVSLARSRDRVTAKGKPIEYRSDNVRVFKNKSGYVVEVSNVQRDVAGRVAPAVYYTPAKKLHPDEAIKALKGGASKVGRTFNEEHLKEIEKGLNHVHKVHLRRQILKGGTLAAGAVGGGLILKKLHDKYVK